MRQAQVLGDKEVKRVLGAISKRSYCTRDRAMFMLSLLAGMRVGEIAALRVSDVYESVGMVKDQIRLSKEQTKGGEARTVLLNAQVQAELTTYSFSLPRKGQEPLFVSKWGKQMSPNSLVQVFGRFYKQAGLSNASSHSGRRSFITQLAHKGVNVRVLAALAGHKNISTTQRYIELNENVLRTAVELM
ncbi:tyrosine-type recombinase/integrase [Aestuariivirga sp.]|uniref:tyrosine-type recombinase/integrase n=1 Tax=Aestuariivirga sp. TaxID=2650926 RepID=UPI003BAC33FC